MTPENWPPNINYLQESVWNESALNSSKTFRKEGLPCLTSLVSLQNRLKIMKTPPGHPSTGYGLYATEDIYPNSFILNYTGKVQLDSFISATNDYCIHLHEGVSIEANTDGNEARFINDYFGIAKRPNVAFDTYVDGNGNFNSGVFSLNKTIRAGEELLVTYGLDFWRSRGIARSGPEWDDSWDE
ncbi:hypothetical protein HDV02_000863 [Globomyces sp. JEL0801]|nr:hypothetical protein HDV02_000863 [Globomyces sp. JEL0801]